MASTQLELPANANTAKAPSLAPSTIDAVALTALRHVICSEMTFKKKTAKTGKAIMTLAAKYAAHNTFTPSNRRGLPGLYTLAHALASNESPRSLDIHRDACRWYGRLTAYAPTFVVEQTRAQAQARTRAQRIRAAQPAAAPVQSQLPAPVPVQPPATPTTVDPQIVGRPRLLADGKLEVKVTATMVVSPGDLLWTDALAAVNG